MESCSIDALTQKQNITKLWKIQFHFSIQLLSMFNCSWAHGLKGRNNMCAFPLNRRIHVDVFTVLGMANIRFVATNIMQFAHVSWKSINQRDQKDPCGHGNSMKLNSKLTDLKHIFHAIRFQQFQSFAKTKILCFARIG